MCYNKSSKNNLVMPQIPRIFQNGKLPSSQKHLRSLKNVHKYIPDWNWLHQFIKPVWENRNMHSTQKSQFLQKCMYCLLKIFVQLQASQRLICESIYQWKASNILQENITTSYPEKHWWHHRDTSFQNGGY